MKTRVSPQIRLLTTLVAGLLCLALAPVPLRAAANDTATLRNIKYGDPVPGFKATNMATGKKEAVLPGKGKPMIMMFFSVRPTFRKKRSLALLAALSELAQSYRNKAAFVGVFSDAKGADTVKKYILSNAQRVKVYADSAKKIHDAYGVFMMPLVVIANSGGKLHEVIPYTYNIRQLVDGNIKLLLGEWTREQFQASLKPKQIAPKSEEEKEFIRRINYGRIMLGKKMYPQAVREFSTAVKLMPKNIEGWVELGNALLEEKEFTKAQNAFNKALAIDPDSDAAIAGLGLVYYRQGKIDQAKPQLESAFISPDPRIEVIIALADIYEQQGNDVKANRLNKLAVAKLMKLYEQRWK